MIPRIKTIIEDLLAGKLDKAKAIAWLYQHAEDAGRDFRDDLAAVAMQGLLASGPHDCEPDGIAHDAYLHADAMLEFRASAQPKTVPPSDWIKNMAKHEGDAEIGAGHMARDPSFD